MFRAFSSRGVMAGPAVGLLLVVVVLVLFGPATQAGAQDIPEPQASAIQLQPGSGVQLLSSDASGITFQVAVPWDQLAVESLTDDGRPFVRLSMPGWSVTQQPGQPQLPVVAIALGVPFGAGLHVEAVPGTASSTALPSPVVPASTLRADWDLDALTQGHALLPTPVIEIDPADEIYGSRAAYPGVLAEITDDGVIRQQRIAGIAVYPVQYQPGAKTVTVYHSLIVHIRFDSTLATDTSGHNVPESAAYEELFRTQLLNYDSARAWRQQPVSATATAPWTPPVPGYKMLVKQEGMYKVTYADLAAAGVPVDDIIPSTLQVMNMGAQVAISVTGEADNSFDPGDYVLFYGQSVNTKYTADNVYWLTYGQGPGLRMASRDGTPSAGATPLPYEARLHMEQNGCGINICYLSRAPGDENLERWLWDYVYPPSKPSWSYTFSLSSLPTEPSTTTLQFRVVGYIDNAINPDHHVKINVNGNLIAEGWWDGITWYTATASFPQSYLAAGNNTITLTSMNDTGVGYDLLYIDWVELTYSRLFTATADLLSFGYDVTGTWKYQVNGLTSDQVLTFDVSDAGAVKEITGGLTVTVGSGFSFLFTDQVTAPTDYLVMSGSKFLSPISIVLDTPSNLQAATNGADYILLTHPAFYSDIVPLADHRASLGLRVAQIDVQDVYDEFGYGLTGATPIHDFLDYAASHWQPPAASYVVLVGDGNYDPKNYLGLNRTSFFPPYLAPVDPWINETAADNRYVTLTEGDNIPDMMLGRLPVNSTSQTSTMLDKIINYEQNPPAGDWNQRLLFVADNADSAGDFAALSDALIGSSVPLPYQYERTYYGETCLTPAECKAAIIAGISDGRLIVNYIGHSGYTFWASEQLFHVNDIASLGNGYKLPIMLPMTCYDGYHIFPQSNLDSMGERIVRATGRGAVASWSPTGLGVATAHDFLDQGFLDALFKDGLRRVGEATTAGKLNLWAAAGNHDLLDTYILFGDPALRVNALDADLEAAKTVEPTGDPRPGDMVTYTLTFTNTGPASAFHVVLTDVIPALLIDPVVVYASPEVLEPIAGITFAWTISDLLPGDSGIVQIRATVDPAAQTGDIILNQAQITTTIPELAPADNADSVTSTVNSLGTDLQVLKTVTPAGGVWPGDLLTYTVAFTNADQEAALGIILTDIIPALLVDPVVVYASPEVLTPTAGVTFAWAIADLMPGEGGSIQIRAAVDPAAQAGDVILNQAEIAMTKPDLVPGNNVATTWTTVYTMGTDIQVFKTVEPAGRVLPGDLLTYTMTFTNAGEEAAFHVVLTDIIPALLIDPVVVYASPEVLTPTAGVTFAWAIADLMPGEGGNIQIHAAVDPAAQAGDVILNQAEIAMSKPDLNPGNNLASTWTTVYSTATDIQVLKTVEPAGEVWPGDLLTYTVTFVNAGQEVASGVVLTDIIPALLIDPVVVFASPEVLTPTAGITFGWLIADLLPGSGGTVQIRAMVDPAAQPGAVILNQAQIVMNNPDLEPGNNASSATTTIRGPDIFRYYLPLMLKAYP